MRIALLTPFYPYRGGIAQFSDRLYTEFANDSEVKVFSYKTLYPKIVFPGQSQLVPNPIEKEELPSERLLSSVNPATYKRTAKAINEYKPDVLIVAYWMPYMAVALSGVCKRISKDIKIVGLIHNALSHEKSRIEIPLAKMFFKRCDAFITMSEGVDKDLKEMNMNRPTIVLNHPIYDQYPALINREDACKQLQLDSSKKGLLFFGLIRSYKGLDILIEAMGLLDDTYQLVIAGECYGGFSSYQQLISLSKNKNNIKVFEHYIPDAEVSVFFSAADALVLPYRTATQSGVIAVAYQLGVPMIATNVGALGESVRNSNTGVVINDVSAESLAKGIELFFAGDYATIYKENLEKERARLSWSSYVHSAKLFISNLDIV